MEVRELSFLWLAFDLYIIRYQWSDIAFSCTRLSNQTEDELFGILGIPEIEPLKRVDGTPLGNGLPAQLVKAADWDECIDEDDEDIRLLDFGESFYHGQEPPKLAQPASLRVPETIFTAHFDYRVDLWRTGCMVRLFLISLRETYLQQSIDLFFLIHELAILVSWRGRSFDLPDDWLRGNAAS